MKSTRITRIAATSLSLLAPLLVALSEGTARAADTVVQIPLTTVLDARSVTTLTAGQLVVFTLPTDGGGLQNAYMTAAGAKMQGAPDGHALPDDGHFAANARHPEVVLHFSNDADPTSPQTHLVAPGGSIAFPVPAATYSKLFLFFNGAAGGTTIKVTLTYADGSEVQNATIPDYYADISATDPVIFNLATDLAKWTKTNQINEANHHNITGAEFHPAATKTLSNVQVERGLEGNLVFWGATGIATSPVAGTGGAGSGGAAGTAGTGANAGTSGMAGSGGTAGVGGVGDAGTAGSIAGAGGVNAGTGGANAAGATSNAGAATIPDAGFAAPDDGCGCRLSAARDSQPRTHTLWLSLAAASAWWLGRRRSRATQN